MTTVFIFLWKTLIHLWSFKAIQGHDLMEDILIHLRYFKAITGHALMDPDKKHSDTPVIFEGYNRPWSNGWFTTGFISLNNLSITRSSIWEMWNLGYASLLANYQSNIIISLVRIESKNNYLLHTRTHYFCSILESVIDMEKNGLINLRTFHSKIFPLLDINHKVEVNNIFHIISEEI